ncbi:MAG: hypothetical protein JO112_07845 [Planctomycetes bacterium]|nr:hypothetical protein [Planctomycetota bacterium]
MAFASVWVFLFLLGSGHFGNDLLSVINAEDYFKARQVEVKAPDLITLAAKAPADAKTQVAQLLAIRWLGEHPEEAKKEAKVHDTLAQIAQGKIAQDAEGFAQDYARRALARLDGQPPPRSPALPENSMTEALAWFPVQASLFGAIDLRSASEAKASDQAAFRDLVSQLIPERERGLLYGFAETVGNLRLDRVAMAYAGDPVASLKSRVYLRFTGKGHRKWLGDFVRQNLTGGEIKEEKDPQGQPLTLISSEKTAPAYALIGDTELIMAGHEGNENALEVVREVLAVRAGRTPGIAKGSFADQLKQVPSQAAGLVMGDLPPDMQREFTGGPVRVLPHQVMITLIKGETLTLHFQGTMDKAEDAQAFADGVNQLKDKGVEALQNLPPEIKIKPDSLRLLTQTLEEVNMEAKGTTVSMTLEIEGEALKALHNLVIDIIKQKADEER